MAPDGPGEDVTRTDPFSSDRLLRGCPRIAWENVPRPVLGRIVLIEPVGRGGMGAVYRGMHRTLGQERAVKVLLASADDDARERFLREARFAAQIDSPHLVRVHDADEDAASGLVFLEMEFVRGRSGAQWVRETKGGVPEDEALAVCLAAARGLEAAHAAGVVHRDIKPGNILIPAGAGGRLNFAATKVADLGLARREESGASITATHMFVGTPGYAPPEQIADAKRAGRPADVFSMGATLYALLTGHAPFEGSSVSDTIVRTTLGKRAPLGDVRKGLSSETIAIVDRCLAMEPGDRFADAGALREALERRLYRDSGAPTAGGSYVRRATDESTVAAPASPVTSGRAPAAAPPPPPKAAPPLSAAPQRPPVEIATPAPRTATPAGSQDVPVTPPPPAGSHAGAWIAGGLALAVFGALVVWWESDDGDEHGSASVGHGESPGAAPTVHQPSAPDAPVAPPVRPVPPLDVPAAPPADPPAETPTAPAADPALAQPPAPATAPPPTKRVITLGGELVRAKLLFCEPMTRVYVGDREVREDDWIPATATTARIERDGYATQTVEIAPNAKGEVWVKPGEWRRAEGKVVVPVLVLGVRAFRGGVPVTGPIAASAGEDVEIEYRRRGFEPQVVRASAVVGETVTVPAPKAWTWTGAMPIDVAAEAKIRFELVTTMEGEVAAAIDAQTGGAVPIGMEWEIERGASSDSETTLRIRVTRVRGRVIDPVDGSFAFDSADADWDELVAEHADQIAAVSPLALFRAGAIDVTFDRDGRATTWTPFPTQALALAAGATGDEESVQRSVIGVFVLRPDTSGDLSQGPWVLQSATPNTAKLAAQIEQEATKAHSALDVSLKDGLGTSLTMRIEAPGITVRIVGRRR